MLNGLRVAKAVRIHAKAARLPDSPARQQEIKPDCPRRTSEISLCADVSHLASGTIDERQPLEIKGECNGERQRPADA